MNNEKLFKIHSLEIAKEEAENKLDDIKRELSSLKYAVYLEMIQSDTLAVKVDGIGLFSVVSELKPSVKNEKILYEYLEETGQGSNIKVKKSLHHKTLQSLNNLHNEEFGCDLPGCTSYQYNSVKVTKS